MAFIVSGRKPPTPGPSTSTPRPAKPGKWKTQTFVGHFKKCRTRNFASAWPP